MNFDALGTILAFDFSHLITTSYEDFIEAAASNDDTIGQLHAYIRIAQLHRRLKQYRQSVTSYTHILQLAQEVKDMNLICRAYTQLGNLYLILAERASNEGDSEENEERLVLESDSNYSSLYTIGMSLQDRNAICHARRGLGLVHAARGEWIEARTQFERHLALCSAIGTADQKAQACHLLAEALRAISSSSLESALGASRALFKRQVELRWEEAAYAAEAGDMLLLMRAYMQLGDLYSQSGSYTHFHGIPKARECYSKVLKIGKETNLSALGSKGADIARDAANKLDALDSGACIIS